MIISHHSSGENLSIYTKKKKIKKALIIQNHFPDDF